MSCVDLTFPLYVQLRFVFIFFPFLQTYTKYLGLLRHLQIYKLILQSRTYKATATVPFCFFFKVGTVLQHARVRFMGKHDRRSSRNMHLIQRKGKFLRPPRTGTRKPNVKKTVCNVVCIIVYIESGYLKNLLHGNRSYVCN